MLRELARRLIFVWMAIVPIMKYLLVLCMLSMIGVIGGILFTLTSVTRISAAIAGISFLLAASIPLSGLLLTKFYYDTE